jgi:hypothetical protein
MTQEEYKVGEEREVMPGVYLTINRPPGTTRVSSDPPLFHKLLESNDLEWLVQEADTLKTSVRMLHDSNRQMRESDIVNDPIIQEVMLNFLI